VKTTEYRYQEQKQCLVLLKGGTGTPVLFVWEPPSPPPQGKLCSRIFSLGTPVFPHYQNPTFDSTKVVSLSHDSACLNNPEAITLLVSITLRP